MPGPNRTPARSSCPPARVGRLVSLGLLALGLAPNPLRAQPVECPYDGNLIANCGFDSDVSGWTVVRGDVTHAPGDGFPQAGSLEVEALVLPQQANFEFHQDVSSLPALTSYEIGVDARLLSGQPAWCVLLVRFLGPGTADVNVPFVPTSAWNRAQLVHTLPWPASSARVTASCGSPDGLPFRLRFDDFLLRPITWGANVGAVLGGCTPAAAIGRGVEFSAVVRNLGPQPADVDVVGTVPAACHWTCDASPDAFCMTGPFAGPLLDAVYLPAGASAVYRGACTDFASATGLTELIASSLNATIVNGYDPDLGDNTAQRQHFVVPDELRPGAKGDLTGDLHPDLLLRRESNWSHVVWEQIGTRRLGQPRAITPQPGASSLVVAVDDFDGDRENDLVVRDAVTGAVEFWRMDGLVRLGEPVPIGGAPTLSLDWQLAATGDFNQDGRPDVLWRNDLTQALAIWLMNGTDRAGTLIPTPDHAVHGNWEVVAALDFDIDGWRDLLWYNETSGRIVLWLMNEAVVRRTGLFTNPPSAGDNNWKVVAGGDFGVGVGGAPCSHDIVWRNATSGKLVVWLMDRAGNRTSGTFVSPAAPSPDPLDWSVIGPH